MQIEGQGNAGSGPGSANRDRLTIHDDSGTARALDYFYLTSQGDFNLAANPAQPNAGLFGSNLAGGVVAVRSMETYIFDDAGENNDLDRVFGATPSGTFADASNPGVNDVLTVGLLSNNSSALIFHDGAPYLSSAPEDLLNAGNQPGLAGGGNSTDLLIEGIGAAGGEGLFLDGNGNPGLPGDGDRAVVMATSESPLTAAGTSADTLLFGFGTDLSGQAILLPGAGPGHAYDTINVTDAAVTTTNNFSGPLTTVHLNAASFAQAAPLSGHAHAGLIVDGGDEDGVQANGVADDITATISTVFNIQVNGNLPGLTLTDPLDPLSSHGDQLSLVALVGGGAFNLFSDTAGHVSIGNSRGDFAVASSGIDRLTLDATATGIVNLIGDDNDPAATQNDYFRVLGRDVTGDNVGTNELQVELGGDWDPVTGAVDLSVPIFIQGVHHLNVSGGGATGFDFAGNATARATNTGFDALDLTPYADNTTGGWGVETHFNPGDAPASAGGLPASDLLVFNGVHGVSENIVIQPAGPGTGQIIDSFANSPGAMPLALVTYAMNANLIVHGSTPAAGDTDTLTLRGTDPLGATSGNDTFDVDPQRQDVAGAPGTSGNELVRVIDSASGVSLYNLQDFTNFPALNVEMLGGDDTLVFASADGSNPHVPKLNLHVDGGAGHDQLQLHGIVAALSDTFNVGPEAGSGTDLMVFAGLTQLTNFTNLEAVQDLVGGVLTVNGTNAPDNITFTGESGAPFGLVKIDNHTTLEFEHKTALTINALGGSDTIGITDPDPALGLNTFTVDGGAAADNDTLTRSSGRRPRTFSPLPGRAPRPGPSRWPAKLPSIIFIPHTWCSMGRTATTFSKSPPMWGACRSSAAAVPTRSISPAPRWAWSSTSMSSTSIST